MDSATLQFLADLLGHAVALIVGILALVRTRRSAVSKLARNEVARIETKAEAWRVMALEVRDQVETTIERLESKRRQLSAVESRLNAREREVDAMEAAGDATNGAGPPVDAADLRAAMREQRRSERGVA